MSKLPTPKSYLTLIIFLLSFFIFSVNAQITITDDGGTTVGNLGYIMGTTDINIPLVKTYTIENNGASPQSIDYILGAGSFVVSNISETLPFSLPPSGTLTFDVTFNRTTPDTETGDIDISGFTYGFTATAQANIPEIEIRVGGTLYADIGSSIPGIDEEYDFGGVSQGEYLDVTFTINNLSGSTADLVFSGTPDLITITGDTEFTVITPPTTPVAVGGSTSFVIRFEPSSVNTFTANISIPNNDLNEGPFDLDLTGSGIQPEIEISQGGTAINSGDTFDFGHVVRSNNPAPAGSSDITFDIENTDIGNLVFTGTPDLLQITGTNAADFTVVTDPSGTIGGGSTGLFQIRFRPSDFGTRTATLTIPNNDVDEGSYVINLTGVGESPEIEWRNWDETTTWVNGDSRSFSDVIVGENRTSAMRIHNIGNIDLTFTGITITGPDASEFSIPAAPNWEALQGPVSPGSFDWIGLVFTPTSPGTKNCILTINSNDLDEPSYVLNITADATTPEIEITKGATPVPGDGSYIEDYGSILLGESSTDLEFTVKNTASGTFAGELKFSDNPRVTLSNTTDFILTDMTGNVNVGASRTFKIQFTPSSLGTKTCTVTIENNDMDEGTYTFDLTGVGAAPEMRVTQGGTHYADGSSTYSFTPDITQGTSSATVTFTIENQNSTTPFDLILDPLLSPDFVEFSGGNAGDFEVTGQPTVSTIGNNTSTTFEIRFTPTSAGTRTTDMVIATNDPDHPTYTIELSGVSITPEFDLFEGTTPYADGSTYNFGNQLRTIPVSGAGPVTFTIRNTGAQPLTIDNDGSGNFVKITGANAADFVLVDITSTVLAAGGGESTFTIDFQPSDLGTRTANVEIHSNDLTEDPYNITLTGTGVTPQMSVSQSGTIANGGTYDFGNALQGGSSAKTFTISNTGDGELAITPASITITGTDSGLFAVTSAPPTSIAAGSSATFVVTFSPSSIGLKTAQISIPNSDLGDNPYVFDLEGTGLTPGIEIAFDGSGILNNNTTPRDVGGTLLGESSSNLIFDINNTGGGSLGLTSSPDRVIISGSDATRFSLTTDAPASIPGSSTGSFILVFTPDPALATGERDYFATLTVANTDLSGDNPYIINIVARGVTPDMNVKQGGTNLPDGSGSYSFGDVQRFQTFGVQGESSNVNFTAENTGSGELTFPSSPIVTIGGTNASDFTPIITDISGDIDAGNDRVFTLQFKPDGVGNRTAMITIDNSDLDEDPYTFEVTGVGISPDIDIKQGGTSIADGGTYDFGGVLRTTTSSVMTFDLENIADGSFDADLLVNGSVTITGTDASDFTLTNADDPDTASPIAPGGSSSFNISFTPSFSGTHTATVTIQSNDYDEATYTFTIQGEGITPEMVVKQGATTLGNGSSTHNFGAVNVSATTDVTFTIENNGTSTLNLGTVNITGTNASEFTILPSPVFPTSIAASSSATFTVRFAPTAVGARDATITIDTDDLTDDPYTFNFLGNGITAGIAIEQGGTGIANTDTYNFGNILQSQNSGLITFDIENTGTSNLDISGTPKVVITGTHATEFVVEDDAPATIAPSGSATFRIRFTPGDLGLRTATATINNSDLSNGTFQIFLQGTSISPNINVAEGGTNYLDGTGVFSFGNILLTENSGDITFDIENLGDGILNLDNDGSGDIVKITGANAGDFSLIADAPSSLAAAGASTFQIRFTPSALGTRTATITIHNSDLDEDPYTFTLQGEGVESEMDLEQGGTAIADGGAFDFGQVLATTTGPTTTFDINNTSTGGILRLTNAGDNVVISGANASEFALVTDAPDNIDPSTTGNFQITFNPTTVGVKVATITINNNDPDEGGYSFSVSGTGVRSEINIKQGGTDITSTTGSHNFGDVLNGESSADISFTVQNLQNGPLNLTTTPNRVEIIGTNPGDFTLVTDAPNTVDPFSDETFVIRFTPTTTGIRSATIRIINNDFDEDTYTFNILGTGVVSEMDIDQGGTAIANGGTHDFGNILRTANSGDIAFTIDNNGSGLLRLTDTPDRVTISGANASDFSLESDAPATIAASGTATFEIRFTPSATGLRTATVSIDNNDSDEDPYTFTIQGTGVTPEIDIDQGGTAIADGGTHNFGGFVLGDNSGDITFTIENNGTSPLNISGGTRVVIAGTNSGDFNLVSDAATGTVATSSSTTFQIRFTPSATGLRTATATITSDDLDESPYVITLNGSGSTPGIDVGQGGTVIANGGSYDFGDVLQDGNSGDVGFFIENTGGSALTLSTNPRVAITGTDASDFALILDAPTTVNALPLPNTVGFTIRFTPSSLGAKSATITIAHDGLTDNPYVIDLDGNSISPEINVEQGATNIADGGSYDFGNILRTTSSGDITFDIENTGTSTLNISGTPRISIGGANPADFILVTDADATVATSGTTNFVLRFTPTASGARTATITIDSDDLDEDPYTITLNGVGITPEMDIEQGGTAIADGAGSYDFGNILQGENSTDISFTINNTGTGILDLSGATRVLLSGAAAADYTLVSDAPTSIAAAGNATFTLRFTPSTTGARNATVTINNSDLDENPYTFDLTGNGVVSEIDVAQGATPLLDGTGTYNFGSVLQGENSSDITFTINNSGSGDLKFTGTPIVDISGINAADFTLVTDATTPIGSSSSGTFILRFNPTGSGSRTATITLTNNDLSGGEGTYTFDVEGTGLVSEIAVDQGGSALPSGTGNHNFGSIFQGQSSADINFTIENTGTGDLKLTDATRVTIGGANAADFILVTDAPATIASGSSANFTIRFTPSTTGVRLATVTINNNDLDEGSYTFNLTGNSITPEINVNQGGTDLLSGVDTYNFGNVIQGESSSNIVFSVQNTTGTGTLNLTSTPRVVIGGTDPGDFTLVADAPTSIGAGGTSTFILSFTPTASGLRQATITIANSDLDEGTYTFNIQGTGTTPEMDVNQGGTAIADGTGSYDFGNVLRTTTSSTITFTIDNLLGTGALNLDGAPNRVSIGGTNPGDFSLVTDAPASIANASSGTFQLSFTPTASGLRTATITISNNDLNENPYTFDITGTGITPEIDIDQGGTAIANGGTHNFGGFIIGDNSGNISFTVTNNGTSPLNLSGGTRVVIGGAHPGDFTLVTDASAGPIANAGTTTFEIQFAPSATGLRTATATITSDDLDESPYIINLNGNGSTPGVDIGQGGTVIANSGSYDFGTIIQGDNSGDIVFYVENTGSSDLNLTSTPTATISGTNAGDFSVTTAPPTPITAGDSQNFAIRFTPSALGSRTATVTIANSSLSDNPYVINLTGTSVSPEIGVRQGFTPIASGGTHNFGTVLQGQNGGNIIFDVQNTGTSTLNISGATKVVITGANSGDFILATDAPASVATSATGNFAIRFAPTGTGARNAVATITSDDLDEGVYTVNLTGNGITPEMDIDQGGTAIADASGSYDFGDVLQGVSTSDVTFTIQNTGTGVLDLTGATRVNISGAAAADYTLVSDAPTTVTASSSVTFTIRFTPSTTGSRNATVTINNSDLDEDPYTFDLMGNGVVSEIEVAQGATPILDGVDSYDFGSVLQGQSSSDITFDINNTGSGDLILSGMDKVDISGTDAGDFILVTDASSPIGPSSSDNFVLRFTPQGSGARTATVTLTTNDLDEGTYTFTLNGTGITPEIAVTQGANSLPTPAGTHNFGNVLQGQSSADIDFTITNSGTGDLLITGADNVNISGTNPGDFILITDASSTVSSGGGTSNFTIRFTPTATGFRFATITINNNDLDEGTYTFNLSGNSITPEINIVQGGTDILNGTGVHSFGSVLQGQSSSNVSFTIENTAGTGLLDLTSTPRISIGGTNSGDFTLVTDAPASILGGGTGSFVLTFNPTATGPRTATITIANTDLDEGTYTFDIQGTGITPEMNINQGGTGIVVGDSYDFGDVLRSTSSADIAFTIENTGTGVLDLTGSPNRVVIGGANASDFTLVTDAPTSINNGSTANFELHFTPSATGVRTATITIDNGDLDEDPYTFDITGTGITPEIDVDQGGTAIADGGTHNFGGFIITDDSGEITFTITNNGTSPLNLSGATRVVIGGANPGDFTLNTDASAGPIANAGTTTFGITFAPTATGLRTATATITNDDLDESPYVINLEGNGSTPGIDIGQGGTVIANGGTYDFGSIIQDDNSGNIIFFIENTGTSALNLTSTPDKVVLGGSHSGDFSVEVDAPATVGASATENFEIRFTPTTLGVRNATITVANSDLSDNPYVINLTGTSVSPEIEVKQGLTPIASGDTHDFGTILQGQNGGDIIFGIENTGTSTLNLSGATKIVITGTNAGDFQLITDAPNNVGVSATGNFAIRFAPTGTGTRTAIATITSDDLDESTYTVNLTGNGISPEMDLNQGGTAIASGVDTYDFGDVLQGENSSDIVFTIENNGSADLDLTGSTRVQISGADASDFSVVTDAPTSVLSSSSTTFTLRFSPSTDGVRNATITINNSDLDEDPYTFNLTGNGVISEVEVAQGGSSLLDGTGVYDFGSIIQGQSSSDINFDISNTGTGPLKLSGVNKVVISGTNASDFTVVTDATSPIASGGNDNFEIRFTPSASGLRTATVTLLTNDLNEGTYTFTINGTGITPEIVVTQGATSLLTPSGTHNFGNVFQGQSSSDITFTISNTGTGNLIISGATKINIGGANAGDFILVTDANSPIGPSSTDNFVIRFTPTATGLRFATITINNNDLDEGTYVFNLTGTSVTPEINVVQGSTPMPDGSGNYDFGSVYQDDNSSEVTFTIENSTGTGSLSLSGTPRVTIGGANATDFSLITDAPTTIGAGGTGTFVVRFNPSATSTGSRTATITLATNDLDEASYDFTIEGTGITPEINVRQGGTDIANGGTYDFGSVITGFSSTDTDFDLQNIAGTGDLLITGASSVNIAGANPGDFTLVTDAASTIGAGTTGNFVIRFTPTAVGARTATVTINNNDLDEGTYTFTLEGDGSSPEIDIDEGGTAIVNTTTYDFGTILLGLTSPVTTFTITNNGTSNLNLSGSPIVQITGVHAGEYALDFSATSANLAPGASTTFTIQFDPVAGGTRIATVTIPNNDVDEGPYTFNLTGFASTEPEIEVVGVVGGTPVFIANGDVTPTTTDNTDFGNLNVGTDFIDLQFAVRNIGSSGLNLTGTPRIAIGGADASEFTLISDASTPVGPSGGENTFIIRFDPSSGGIKNAQITIANDDADEGLYTFNIVGRGVEPIIGVRQGGTSIPYTGTYDFGDVAIGNESGELVFTIENTGDDDLNLTGLSDKVSITGVNSSEFIFVGTQPSTPIAPAGTQTFIIKFVPVGPVGTAVRSATVTIDNDDIDRAPYTFSIRGTGIDTNQPDMIVRRVDNGSRVANGSAIDFGIVDIAQSEQFTFEITNEGTANLRFSDFSLNSSGFTVLDPLVDSLVPGEQDILTIQYSPIESVSYIASLSFATNDIPVYSLDLTGIGGEVLPNIVVTLESDTLVSETLIDFNAVNIGEVSIKPFIISNSGETVLFIQDITLSSTVYTFEFPRTPMTILPGESDTLKLELSPTIDETGRHEGSLVIANSDPDISSFIINIEGSAASPIIIPNLFSPDSDGINDNFVLHADPDNVANIVLRVYDRYNNIVFESDNVQEITQIGWDGTRNGIPLPTDTYFWKVEGTFADGSPVQFDGQQQGKVRLVVE